MRRLRNGWRAEGWGHAGWRRERRRPKPTVVALQPIPCFCQPVRTDRERAASIAHALLHANCHFSEFHRRWGQVPTCPKRCRRCCSRCLAPFRCPRPTAQRQHRTFPGQHCRQCRLQLARSVLLELFHLSLGFQQLAAQALVPGRGLLAHCFPKDRENESAPRLPRAATASGPESGCEPRC